MCATAFCFIEFGGGEKHIVLQIVSIFINFIKAVDMIEFINIYNKLEELVKQYQKIGQEKTNKLKGVVLF